MTDQDTLFDLTPLYNRKIEKPAQARNAIGECAQRFVTEFLNLSESGIDGRKAVCPDFHIDSSIFGEIKSVGKNNRALIYKWRLEKERANFKDDEFYYVFANHRCLISVESGAHVVQYFKDNPPVLYVCTLGDIHALLSQKKVKKFSLFKEDPNPRIGYNRKGYIDGGWQFSLREFNFSGCILKESIYCSSPVFTRVYYTEGGLNLITRLQPVAKNL